MTYEFDQAFIAESFQALYVERGRPSLGRADLARRDEFCEDLAQQVRRVVRHLEVRPEPVDQ